MSGTVVQASCASLAVASSLARCRVRATKICPASARRGGQARPDAALHMRTSNAMRSHGPRAVHRLAQAGGSIDRDTHGPLSEDAENSVKTAPVTSRPGANIAAAAAFALLLSLVHPELAAAADDDFYIYTTKDLAVDLVSPLVAWKVVTLALRQESPVWLDVIIYASTAAAAFVVFTGVDALDSYLQ